MMQTTQVIENVVCQGVSLTHYKCSCGSDFYAKAGDTEVKSCGHERARRDPGSFVITPTPEPDRTAVIRRILHRPEPQDEKAVAVQMVKGLVRRGAYRLWEEAGRPEGRADEFWLKSEAMFREAVAST